MSDDWSLWPFTAAVPSTLLALFANVREWQARRSRLLVTVDEEVWHDDTMYGEYYVVQAINVSDRPIRVHVARWTSNQAQVASVGLLVLLLFRRKPLSPHWRPVAWSPGWR